MKSHPVPSGILLPHHPPRPPAWTHMDKQAHTLMRVKHIAKDIDVVPVCDPAVPVVDESPVHFLNRGEWTIGESDDVLMS